ncbi:iron reductase domain protein [Hyaloscypha bicolor E]|uniref:Iron reductase domain protein n=1 Tax=Hyaloscypha bicolor E TaxID=1095630 RepID=A0A2J6T225_9HELO|nr:iron reductase domain protein [Hyaloscypha bicolor E]PMD57074.1 iron reductase domain protein [Hyaloscypha bicolor E]
MVRIGSALAIAGFFITTTTAVVTSVASGFVASDQTISFALNIPQNDSNNDLYFSMQASASFSWMAIGMGNDKMDNTLIFMVYTDSTGKNVTISPRLSSGHTEPSYTKDVTIQVQPGTGIANGNMTVNAICSNCRSWKGSKIDPANTAEKFIFATGPDGNINSNSLSAGIKRHASYGAFTMDLTKAVGAAQIPIVATSDSSGTVQTQDTTDHDFSAPLHACVMILAFVGLMPAAFLGIYAGTMYNRSKSWNSAHQIFGIFIIFAMVGQFALGFLHHRMYNKTQAPTKLAPYHVWLGRVVILAGITNGFLGFPLALNSKYNWALLALTLLMVIIFSPIWFWKWRSDSKKSPIGNMSDSDGYQSQPWNSGPSGSNIDLGSYNNGQQHPPQPMNYPPPNYSYQTPQEGRTFV